MIILYKNPIGFTGYRVLVKHNYGIITLIQLNDLSSHLLWYAESRRQKCVLKMSCPQLLLRLYMVVNN
jgi:hypothetical protein